LPTDAPTYVVTGSASGIGAATVQALARDSHGTFSQNLNLGGGIALP